MIKFCKHCNRLGTFYTEEVQRVMLISLKNLKLNLENFNG